MTWLEIVILAIVEGITEFLPVSSTGHMIITQAFLGIESTGFVKTFIVNIQFGAILSVIVLYWKNFFQTVNFYYKLFVAFIPAAILGFIFGEQIDRLLENVVVIAFSLLAGGIVLLFVDKWFNKSGNNEDVTYRKAFNIGLFQCIAMIPGVSRSAATIIGGMSQKLSRKAAAEFSFFLAVPTMFAASAYKLYKGYGTFTGDDVIFLAAGNILSFLVAIAAIKTFITFITKYGFKWFGWYRIIVGILLLILMAAGYNLQIL